MTKTYKEALAEAQAALQDLKERGDAAIDGEWDDDFDREIFTPEEIAASDLRVEIISELIKARNEKGISQRELGELSGVKQPVIARMERGTSIPNVNTLIKVLAPLGKKLAIVPM